MSNAVVLTTYDASTAENRDQHPLALTPAQKIAIEKSWQIVEDDIGLLKGGIILFMRSAYTSLQIMQKLATLP